MHYWNHPSLDPETWSLFVSSVRRISREFPPLWKMEPSLDDSLWISMSGRNVTFSSTPGAGSFDGKSPLENLFIMASLCLFSDLFPSVVVNSTAHSALWGEALKIARVVKPDCQPMSPSTASLRQTETEAILKAMRASGSKIGKASKELGISRYALRRKLVKFGIHP